MRKHKVVILCMVLVCVSVILNWPIPFSKSVRALEISLSDSNHLAERSITIVGHYNLNLFKSDRFEGKISISGYSETTDYDSMAPIDISFNDGDGLRYSNTYKGDIYLWGNIFSEKFFRNMVLVAYNHDMNNPNVGWYNATNAICIVSNATSYEQALIAAQNALGYS